MPAFDAKEQDAYPTVGWQNYDKSPRINVQWAWSIGELNSLAYTASHDLKGLLRGVQNYFRFLIEDYASVLHEERVAKLLAWTVLG